MKKARRDAESEKVQSSPVSKSLLKAFQIKAQGRAATLGKGDRQ